jgi:phosphoglycerol transferase MdoB-like AlkP superfamily enzyme
LPAPCHIIHSMSGHRVPKRPRPVTITYWGVILFGVWNIGRGVALSKQSSLLIALNVQPDPRVRTVFAFMWAFLFLGSAWTLRQKRPFIRYAIPILLLGYALYELGIWLLFTQIPLNRASWLLTGTRYLIVILFTYWALNRPTAKYYFYEEGGGNGPT